MLSAVLRSNQAVQVSIAIMDTFVRLRQTLAGNQDLARTVHRHDREIVVLFDRVEKLLAPPDPPEKRPIGFGTKWEDKKS